MRKTPAYTSTNMAAKVTPSKGAVSQSAVTSGNGSKPSPANIKPIAVVPTTPRQKCPIREVTLRPVYSSPRKTSQNSITVMAKTDRKKTA